MLKQSGGAALCVAAVALCQPAHARFLQSDPIGLKGGISTYAAVNNNPLMYVDPLGLRADTDLCAGLSAQGCMQMGQFSPDYTQVTGSWYIFSANLSVSGDTAFGSINVSRNYTNFASLFKPSFSADIGFMNSTCEDTAKRRKLTDSLLHGFSQSAGAYYFAGGSEVYSPGTGTATELGIGMGVTATPAGNGWTVLLFGNGNP